jgi:hypothetical protein
MDAHTRALLQKAPLQLLVPLSILLAGCAVSALIGRKRGRQVRSFEVGCDDGEDVCPHAGSCFCGTVRVVVRAPSRLTVFDERLKLRFPHICVVPERLTVLSGESALKTLSYHNGAVTHHFCCNCGRNCVRSSPFPASPDFACYSLCPPGMHVYRTLRSTIHVNADLLESDGVTSRNVQFYESGLEPEAFVFDHAVAVSSSRQASLSAPQTSESVMAAAANASPSSLANRPCQSITTTGVMVETGISAFRMLLVSFHSAGRPVLRGSGWAHRPVKICRSAE